MRHGVFSDLQSLVSEPVDATHQTSESLGVNVATASVVLVNVKEQVPLDDWPVHAAPPHEYNSVPAPCTVLLAVEGNGIAVNVTEVPFANVEEHVPGHDMPAGLEVTVPLPTTETVSDEVPPELLAELLLPPPLPPQLAMRNAAPIAAPICNRFLT